MTRRLSARIILSIIALIMGGLLIWAFMKHNAEFSEIELMPEIRGLTIQDGSFVSTVFLDSTKRTAVLFFHPECEFCKKELEGILARHSDFKNLQWVFITLASAETVEAFLKDYPLDLIPYSYIIRENWPDTFEQFGVKAPPALFLYNEHKCLIGHHLSATSIETVVRELQ